MQQRPPGSAAAYRSAKPRAVSAARFETALTEIEQVQHAERLFGDPDFLIRLVTSDINHYQHIRDTRLATLPGVQKITSNIVMRRIVDHRPLTTPNTNKPERSRVTSG
ncbi:MAG: Lrp/AsnC ligand binding domain-containing protein [Actinomycetota bacterium]|nr:Lrp/AsnC ligand binding domain-containing protein [Actinomycetota bacterium]